MKVTCYNKEEAEAAFEMAGKPGYYHAATDNDKLPIGALRLTFVPVNRIKSTKPGDK